MSLLIGAHRPNEGRVMVEKPNWHGRIVSDPEVLGGKPCVAGTRISVELILGWLAAGWTFEQLLEAYPHITRDDVLAALAFAAEMMHDEKYLAAHKAA